MTKSQSSSRRACAIGLILALLGMIVPATAAPAAEGATVTIQLIGGAPGTDLVLTSATDAAVSFEATSDAAAFVQFSGVPRGSYTLSFANGEVAWSRVVPVGSITVGSGNATAMAFAYRKGTINGTLPSDGIDTVIHILEQSGDNWEEIANSATSDTVQIASDGTFRAYLPRLGDYAVYFEPSESSRYLPSHNSSLQPAVQMGVGIDGPLRAGGEDTASNWGSVDLVPAAVVEGSVTDVDGKPVSGVDVVLTSNGAPYDWGTNTASAIATSVTDANGDYRLKAFVDESRAFQVTAYGAGSYVDTASGVFALSPTTRHQAGIDFSIAYESVPPTATVEVANPMLGIGGTSLVRFTFSEAVTGFGNEDVLVSNGTLSSVSSEDGGLTWTATFTPAGSVTDLSNVITLDMTGLTDEVGNAGVGTVDSNNYVIDTIRPTAAVVVENSALAMGETSLVTFAFSEAVTGFGHADLMVSNGSLGPVSSADSGLTWTATFTPTDRIIEATNAITLDMTGVIDYVGNAGVGVVNSNNYAIDTVPPTPAPTVEDVDTESSDVVVTGTGIVGAAVAVAGDAAGAAIVNADGRWSLELDLEVGEYHVSVTQTTNGKESEPVAGTVIVRPIAPAVVSIEPNVAFPHSEAPSQISGLGVEGATISVEVGGEIYTTVVTSAGWMVDFGAPLAAGTYSATVTQTVNGITSAETTADFVVDQAVPVPVEPPSSVDPAEPGEPADPTDQAASVDSDVISNSGDSLATTGADPMAPLGVLGLAMLLLGAIAVITARRQKTVA